MELNNDDWMSCPYDPSHRVPRLRIQRHILKCEKTHPPLEICPYNYTHRHPADKIKEHCVNCPDKPEEQYDMNPPKGGMITTPKPILQQEYLSESDPNHECWD